VPLGEGAFAFSQSDEIGSVRIGRKRRELVRALLGVPPRLLPAGQGAILAAVFNSMLRQLQSRS